MQTYAVSTSNQHNRVTRPTQPPFGVVFDSFMILLPKFSATKAIPVEDIKEPPFMPMSDERQIVGRADKPHRTRRTWVGPADCAVADSKSRNKSVGRSRVKHQLTRWCLYFHLLARRSSQGESKVGETVGAVAAASKPVSRPSAAVVAQARAVSSQAALSQTLFYLLSR